MSTVEEVIKEFNAVNDRYNELLDKLIAAKVPGVINPKAAGCSVGEVCHGGTFKKLDLGRPVETPK